jgi:mono/diheme cytochrome c family protein
VIIAAIAVVSLFFAPWPTVGLLALATASLWLYRVRSNRNPPSSKQERARMMASSGLLVLAGTFFAIQFIPYGRAHENPPVAVETSWDSAETEDLFRRACADCHSNETVWPWFSSIAPASWWVTANVEEGRAAFNVSETVFTRDQVAIAIDEISSGRMPPAYYTMTKLSARLSDEETARLIEGLERSMTAP